VVANCFYVHPLLSPKTHTHTDIHSGPQRCTEGQDETFCLKMAKGEDEEGKAMKAE